MRYFNLFILFLVFMMPSFLSAQENQVINSNYLVEYGISPRVLDAAFNTMFQDGSFIQNLSIELFDGQDVAQKRINMEMIFDPNYKQGLDIRFVYDPETGLPVKRKKLRNYAETNHYISRTPVSYLYDESSLKLLSENADNAVIEFYYRKYSIPGNIRRIKKMKGKIYITNGKLDRVVLTNTVPIKYNGNVLKYEKISWFSKPENAGGYLISATQENVVLKKGKETKSYTNKTETTRYCDEAGNEIVWKGEEKAKPLFAGKPADTIKVGLGPALPVFGRAAKKAGYVLPRTFGFDVFTHVQKEKMQFTNLAVGFNPDSLTNLNDFFDFPNSKVDQTVGLAMGRADMWVFPFLDIMVLAGVGESYINAPLRLDEELKQKLEDWGWLIGIDSVPDEIHIETNVTARIFGGGLTLAWGYKNFNVSVNGMFMATQLQEANTTNKALVISPLVGYSTRWFNVMAGAQAQFYETRVVGNFLLPKGNLYYDVDFVAKNWNFIAGVYKGGIWNHFNFAAQFGFGSRKSMTVIVGYRI